VDIKQNISSQPHGQDAIKQRRVLFRKQLVLPAEHGSWAWLLVPFGVGIGVIGRVNIAVFLILLGGLAAFLVRQPATAWLRIRQGKGRRADGPLAAGWTVGLTAVALLCLISLLALGHTALLWLWGPLAVLFVIYLAAAYRGRANTRTLWMEVAGAAGLAAGGRLDNDAWALWGLLAGLNVLGALYVRARIADTHQRPANRPALLWSHGAAFLMAGAAARLEIIPLLVALPLAGLLARALWTAVQPRPIANIKRFGFTEIGVELLSGLFIIAGYWLQRL
jgi:hypothetical protein